MTDRCRPSLTRRQILAGLVASAGQAAWAGAPTFSPQPLARPEGFQPLAAPEVEALIARAGLGGRLTLAIADASTGRMLETRNPVLALPPASVAKAITAQYALEALGPAHAFATRVVATAPLLNGRVDGDLVLLGGGDPTLDTKALAEMAAALKSTGLREVTGRFLVSGGAIPHVHEIDPGQPEYLGYNPAISGLNLNYNRVHFEWKKAGDDYNVTMDARAENYRPEVTISQMEIVDRRTPIYDYSNGGAVEAWTVARRALGNGGARWLPVRQPELYAGEVFQTLCRSHGIVLPNATLAKGIPAGVTLVERKSPPLSRILNAMLVHSTNLIAEVAGLSATIARGGQPDGLADSGTAMAAWMRQRLGARKPVFADHSGLSDATRVTATDMVNALVRIGPNSTLASILKPVPLRDAQGNLAQGAKATVLAKTGTLNFVSGLAGFVKGSERNLAFAIFAADTERRAGIPESHRERPPGARSWNSRARRLQWGLLNRWIQLYGG